MQFHALLNRALLQSVLLVTMLAGGNAFAETPDATAPASPAIEIPSLPTTAGVETVIEDDEPQLRARLLVSSATEDGSGRRVGVLLDLDPGWHVYWRNPGGTGIAPSLGLEADGHTVGEIAWPAPTTFEEADGLFTTYGYEGSVLLSAPLLARNDGLDAPHEGELIARADARVLICRTQCVPAEFELSMPLNQPLESADQQQVDRLFDASVASVPARAPLIGIQATAHWRNGSPATDELAGLEFSLNTCGRSEANCPSLVHDAEAFPFLPIDGETFEISSFEVLSEDKQSGDVVMALEATRLEEGKDRLWGLIPLRDATGRLHYVEVDVPIEPIPAQVTPQAAGTSFSGWVHIFLLAMLGGLILNGMPCVLPVLAIKIVAIADMGEKDRREVRLNGLAYTAGVMGSMGVLAAIVLGLRAAGHSVGWGFQFQEPLFVAGISALLVTFALNLFGVFEIELGQGKLATVGQESTGLTRSLFEGLLAVVLATPCTAPFLGTAVGFAFASSGFGIAAIFLAIGLGLAAPFLAVSFVPSLARFIPRSGPWMNTLRAGLGFCLLATVVWLLWVLGQSGGTTAVVSMAGVLLLLSFLLWVLGQMQPLGNQWVGRASALGIALVAFTGFNIIELDRADSPHSTIEAGASSEAGWQVYSEARVASTLAKGQPAFVVFTADWCITCQVNERTVLERQTIRDAFASRGYALFKADWTRRDEPIRLKLAEFGRAGVPLYLVYRPDRPEEPQVLSELLSQREVLAALDPPDTQPRI